MHALVWHRQKQEPTVQIGLSSTATKTAIDSCGIFTTERLAFPCNDGCCCCC